MISIYILKDPIDGSVRYVGKTSKPLHVRLAGHIAAAKAGGSDKDRWIVDALKAGRKPFIELLERCKDGEGWCEREIYWIAYYKMIGMQLMNITDGGLGVKGEKVKRRKGSVSNGSHAVVLDR